MFLQVYHHAGVVILMWGFVVTAHTTAGLILIVLNSFIHSLMYTYYTLAAFGYNSPLKHYLTQAQLVQFLTGIAVTVPALFKENCLNQAQKVVLGGLHIYTIFLIYLFAQFYVSSYMKKGKDSSGKGAKKSSTQKSD
jgi:hypothetical protein